MSSKSYTIDFSNKDERRKLHTYLKTLYGKFQIVFHETTPYQYKTRYKYYFGHVMKVIEESTIFQDATGRPLNGSEIHIIMRMKFAPLIIQNSLTKEMVVSAKQTSQMGDGEFIGEFEEKIVMMFSSDPYYMDFMDRDEWIKMRKKWHRSEKEKKESE